MWLKLRNNLFYSYLINLVSSHSSVNKMIDEESDEDDAVVVGSSVSLSKYRNNQKPPYDKRSNENNGRSHEEVNRRSNVKPIHDDDHISLDTRSRKSEIVDKSSSLNNARMKGTLESFVNSDELHRKKSHKLIEGDFFFTNNTIILIMQQSCSSHTNNSFHAQTFSLPNNHSSSIIIIT